MLLKSFFLTVTNTRREKVTLIREAQPTVGNIMVDWLSTNLEEEDEEPRKNVVKKI